MKRNNFKKLFLLFPTLILLTSCNINDFLNIADEIKEKLFPNVWAFLVQFLAFIIMIVIVIVFAYKPVKKFIEARKEALNKEVKDTFEAKAKYESLQLEAQKEIALSHEKASEILKEAKKQGEIERNQIILDAEKEAKNKLEEADIAIERDKKAAEKDIKENITDVAFTISSKILEREVNKDDNKKIINDFINDKEIK